MISILITLFIIFIIFEIADYFHADIHAISYFDAAILTFAAPLLYFDLAARHDYISF